MNSNSHKVVLRLASRLTKVFHLMFLCMIVLGTVISMAERGWAQEPAQPETKPEPQVKIDWQAGPTTGKLGDIAEIDIPQGYRFADKAGAIKLLQVTQNIPSGRELGVLISDKADWFMLFEFADDGYVKDDERDKLDADAILKSLQEGTDNANAERAKHGWTPLHVTGWQRTPFYDPQTHNLTWASVVSSNHPEKDSAVNHSIRILGRRGTMHVDLIASPEEYASITPQFNSLIAGFHFTGGNRYSDFAQGDKVAEYGLTALIVGGGAAVALKTGLFAKLGILLLKLWKFILMGLVAAGAAIKRFFNKLFGSEEKIEDPNSKAASQGQ